LLPDFGESPDAFAAAVLGWVKETQTTVVVPSSDQSIASLRPWRTLIEEHANLAMASEAALGIAADKQATLRIAGELGIAVPRTVVVDSVDEVPVAMAEIGYPAVIKPRSSWLRDFGGERLISRAVLNEREALQAVATLQRSGARGLIQQLLRGRREGLGLFRVEGTVVGEFAHLSLRTTPMLGGACAMRESIAMPDDLRAAAVRLIDAIDLEGYSQIEFRRDAEGQPLLMEINARLSGSIELASRSGIDFPLMLWQWASGGPVQKCGGYRTGVRLRWLTGDGRWLLETLRGPGRPDSMSSGRAVATFASDFARRSAYDYVDLSDPLPAAAELGRVLSKAGANVVKRFRQGSSVVAVNQAKSL
jgi:predicted ATP-grasp superfamily ATP-dependent carboligase